MHSDFSKYFFMNVILLISLNFSISQQSNEIYLQNYWSFSENLIDQINYKQIFSYGKANFSIDRMGQLSAFSLNDGYALINSSLYLNNNFTITLWLNLKTNSEKAESSIIEFSTESFSFGLVCKYTKKSPKLIYWFQTKLISTEIELNEWIHVAFGLNQNGQSFLYLNASKVDSSFTYKINSSFVKRCILGDKNDSSIKIYIDDLKIFNSSLTKNKIQNDIVNNCTINPCKNNGECYQNYPYSEASITCICQPDYSGTFCQKALDYDPYINVIYKVVLACIVLSTLLLILCICLFIMKCSQFKRRNQIRRQQAEGNLNTGYTSSNNQMIYTINGQLNRSNSIISFDSALRNSTAVAEKDFSPPTYSEYTKQEKKT